MAAKKSAPGTVTAEQKRGVKAHSAGADVGETRAACASWWKVPTRESGAVKAVRTEAERRLEGAEGLIYGLTLDTDEPWTEERLRDWQVRAYRACLGLPGPDAEKPLVWMDGPTGCGKDQIIAAVVLAVICYAPEGFRAVVLSTDKDRAADAIETTKGFCRRDSARLGQYVTFTRNEIRPADESRDVKVVIEPCDGASASGARADLFILNEVQSWRDPHGQRVWTETIARYGKRGGRFVVFSNAPFTGRGDWRREAWETARTDKDSWVYFPVRVADCPWITPEYLAKQRKNLPPAVYKRLFECVPTDGRGELVDKAVLERCTHKDLHAMPFGLVPARLGVRFAGCDLGITRDHAVIVVLCLTPEQTIFLERIDVWVPDPHSPDETAREVSIDDVERRLMHYGIEWGASVLLDPYQGVHMRQHIEAAGITVTQVDATATNLTEQASAVVDVFRDGRIRLFPDAGRTSLGNGVVTSLGQQLLDAEIREQERGIRIVSKKTRAGHGDQASAFALALLGAVRAGVYSVPVVAEPSGAHGHGRGRNGPDPRAARPLNYFGARPQGRRRVTPWRSLTAS